jgi:hypothetical protein
MKKTFLMILLQTLLLAGVLNAQQWQQRQTIPNWYAEPTLVFALGDYGYWGSMLGDLALWRYDTNNDSWQQMNNLPYPHGMMPFTINNVAYYMPVVNDQIFLYRYEEGTDSWTEVSQFPGTPRQGNFVFVVGNSAYMSCGRDFTGGHLQDNWEFNTEENTWTQRADFPGYQRTLGGAFALNGKGYAGLGWTDSNFPDPYETDFYQYDPINDTWTQKSDLPISRGRVAVSGFSINNRGYILGGEMANPAEWTAELLQYNDTTDSWTQLAPFPEGGQNFINTFVVGNSAFCGKTSLWEFNSAAESNPCNALDPALQNGLVGYWPFCGNANDESGNGNNGVVNGATLTEDRFGNAGAAYNFDGVGNQITIDGVALASGDFTISGWINSLDANGFDSFNTILNFYSPNSEQNLGLELVTIDNLVNQLRFTMRETIGEDYDAVTPNELPYNQWLNFMLIRNGNQQQLYLNNVLISTSENVTTNDVTQTELLFLGSSFNLEPCPNSRRNHFTLHR